MNDLSLEQQIGLWRHFLQRRQAIDAEDIAELEDHLREQIAALMEAGLAADEAFLVGVKRMGELDAIAREFAREHSERLWKQLVLASLDDPPRRKDALAAILFAGASAVAIKLPALFGVSAIDHPFYIRNLALLVLPLLAAYFILKRGAAQTPHSRHVAALMLAGAVIVNIYPFRPAGHTELLVGLHLPIALWVLIGMTYAGKRWQESAGRMDFIRFSGEFFIYYVLIALGGGVLMIATFLVFQAISVDVEPFLASWVLPCGAAGAVVIAAWLVEAKQSVIENMAPVLTRLFTPLFAASLMAFLATLVWTGHGVAVDRDVLIAFDLLLAVVLGLVLYAISARDPLAPPGSFDVLQVILILSALLADAYALLAIGARIQEFGFSPNRVAALGENVLLLVNLAWSAVLYVRFLLRRGSSADLERWQTRYLPVYGIWAALVVVVFPPAFGFA